MIDNTVGCLKKQIEEELTQYLTETIQVGEEPNYSQAKLVKRISLFETHTYPTGKFDSQKNYKFWFDIISPRRDAEVKNIDWDSKAIEIYSTRKVDEFPNMIVNLKLDEYLRTTGQAEKINSSIEEGSGWGNCLWKRIPGPEAYERVDLRNVYIINQTAQTVDDTAVIERHQFTQSNLRAMEGKWDNIAEVIAGMKTNTSATQIGDVEKSTTTPRYEVYERNGEVCLYDLKETRGEKPTEADKEKYTNAKVIAVGKGTLTGVTIEFIVFAEGTPKKNSDIYKEFHRSVYKGKWFREGIYELLFDTQVRANQIGNQIARGLEYASRLVLSSNDKLIIQNVTTDLNNGDIVKTSDLKQVDLRMHGFDQLLADWNRCIEMANEITNSREVVMGDNTPSGQPFRTTGLLNQNANKLFEFIREKFGIPFSEVVEFWIVPNLVKDITSQDVLRLTGDADMLDRLCMSIVDSWYVENLVSFPPHTAEVAQIIKQQQMQELRKRPQLLMKSVKALFTGYAPHAIVDITGEQLNLESDLATLSSFVALEMDPVRRTAMIELMMKKKNIDVGALPKSPPQPVPGSSPQPANTPGGMIKQNSQSSMGGVKQPAMAGQ